MLAIMARKRSVREEEAIILLLLLRRRRRRWIRRRRRQRRMRARQIFQQRPRQGEYHQLLQEMRLSDPDSHFKYLRMTKGRFDSLLAEVPLTLSWTAHSQSGLHVLSQHHICPLISRPVPSSETKLGHPWQHG